MTVTTSLSPDRQALAITMGDPCGIGPEIIVKAFAQDPHATRGAFVVGDVGVLRRAVQVLDGALRWPVIELENAAEALSVPPRCIPVLQVVPAVSVLPWGQVCAEAGKAAGDCVFWAVRAALKGDVSAVVTAPLHKEALSAAGPPYDLYPGHTELLQAEAAEFIQKPVAEVPVRMMLANQELRTVLVSIHVSLRQAIEAVTANPKLHTRDLGGEATTQQVTEAVCKMLRH